jgi:DNA-binding response OmpR family regulator
MHYLGSSIKEGLDKAKRQSPDLIIVGYLEPRGTSFELHNKLREGRTTRDIPLLVVDVRPEEHLRKGWRRDEGMKMNAEEYMSRPFEPAELKETVNRILHRVGVTTMELAEVLEQMEMTLARIDQIEKQLVK